MNRARAWLWRLAGLFGHKRRETELAAELESHLALHVEDNLRAGMTPEEARRQAMLKLGGLEQAKEGYRERRGIPALETLFQDLRYGLRMLRKSPGFTGVAVLTLALGIGANSAIFSVVNAVLLHTLPFREPARLVNITEMETFLADAPVTPADFCQWKAQSTSFDHIDAVVPFRTVLTGDGPPAELSALGVTSDFFPMLGIQPLLGRDFAPDDGSPARGKVVILNYEFWRDRFGSDPGAIGRTLDLSGETHTIIGVLPPGLRFEYPSPQLLAATNCQVKSMATGHNHSIGVWARLRPGVGQRQAQAEMDAIAARLTKQYPATNTGIGAHVQPLTEVFAAPARAPLLLLLGAVGFVLLIACVNVANLQVVRGSSRRKEVAVRAALGASRWRLVRQLLAENLLLGLGGGGLGLLLSIWGVEALKLGLPPELTGLWRIDVDGTVIAFTFTVAVLASVLFGLTPALNASRVSLNDALGSASRLTAGLASHRLRSLLVIAETALALVLLVGAGLMFRSFLLLSADYPGFNPGGVLTMRVDLPGSKYAKADRQIAFFQQALSRVAAVPGVAAAGAGMSLPGQNASSTDPSIVGRPAPPSGENPLAGYTIVTPGYFAAAQIPLLRGRLFTASDDAKPSSTPVVIVDRRFAETYFSRQDPIGQQLGLWNSKLTIVGVVGNVKEHGFNENMAEFYLPHAQAAGDSLALVVRAAGDPMALARSVTEAIQSVDHDQPVDRVRTLEQVYESGLLGSRLNAFLLVTFGLLALLLAAVGIYGVISHAAAQRAQEMGIRMALGASRPEILKLILSQGARLALTGVAIGMAGAVALTRVMAALLFHVKPTDPATFAAAAAALLAAALAASWVPAQRAMKTEPAVALRNE